MADLTLPFIKWRDGRPKFAPGARERALGFVGCNLQHDNGAWLTFEQTKAWSDVRMAEIQAARISGKRKRPTARKGSTIGDLLDDWMGSDHFAGLAEKTRDSYRKAAAAVRFKPETRGDATTRRAKDRAAVLLGQSAPEREREPFAGKPVSAIGAPELNDFFLYLKRERGHHMALAVIGTISAAYTWGVTSVRWRLTSNPRHELSLPQSTPRIVIYTDAEIRALLAAADELGRPSIGDAIMLGLFTGQRQGDRLALEDLGLVEGRRQFRQSKTGAIVAIPEAPQLRVRLEAAKARVAAIVLKRGARRSTIVVDETTGHAFVQDTYRHVFGEVRARAAIGSPSLAKKRDQDLRDTAVTWLARAGATLPEIAAITGHSLRSIHNVLKHYLAITPELADSGIAKLVAWMSKEGMAV